MGRSVEIIQPNLNVSAGIPFNLHDMRGYSAFPVYLIGTSYSGLENGSKSQTFWALIPPLPFLNFVFLKIHGISVPQFPQL